MSDLFSSLNISQPSSSPIVGATDLESTPPVAQSAPKGEFNQLSLGISYTVGGVEGTSEGSTILIQDSPGLRVGTTVAQVLNPEFLCCGLIGNSGTKFCIKGKDCTTVTHSLPMRKHPVSLGLYILDERSKACFIEPVIDSSLLEPKVVERLLSFKGDFESTRKEFVFIKSQDGANASDIDGYARPNLSKTVAFKTPSKNRGTRKRTTSSNMSDMVNAILVKLSQESEKESQVKFENQEQLNDSVTELLAHSKEIKSLMPPIVSAFDALEQTVDEKSDLLYGSLQFLQQLEAAIGTQSKFLKTQNVEPTVWGSISELLSLFQKLENKSESKFSTTSNEIQQMKTTVLATNKLEKDKLQHEIINLLQGWKVIIEGLNSRVTSLENHNKTTSSSASGTRTRSINPFSGLGINDTSNSDDNSMDANTSSPNSNLLESISDRLSAIEKQTNDQSKDGLKGSVRFSGVTFTGKNDVGAWLDRNWGEVGAIPPYGLFADPQLLLHWIWILLSGTTNSSARDMKDRISIDMSQDKTYAIDSYQHYIPLVFTGKKSSMLNTSGMEKSRLAQIPSFESWDDATGENGLKQQIAEGLSLVKHSISDLIDETFEDCPDIRAFALGMLHTSCSFIESLGTYISETYNNFKDVVGNEKSVWGLVTFVVEQIFRKDFGQVRAKTIGAIDANNRTSGIKIIWSSIKCVDVAQQFMSHGIKNAPAVSASYVRFVITHSNMGKVATILEDNKRLKRKIDDLEITVMSIKKSVENVKKVADQAMSKAGNNATVKPKAKKKKTETSENETKED